MQSSKTPWIAVAVFSIGALLVGNLTAQKAGGVPDTGALFISMVEELKGVSKKLDGIQASLDSGKITVRVVSEEKK